MSLFRIKIPSKNTIFSTFGTSVEYYDFVIYGMLTDVMNRVFFNGGIISGYFSFALGYLARPVGAVIFGYIADNYGRKVSLVSSILLISVSTLLIACLNVDLFGMQLLIIFRLLQGVAFGAEMSSAVVIAIESSHHKSPEHGFVISGSALGTVMASLSCFYLFAFFTQDEITEYAWRFPFFLAGIVSLACYFMRKNLSESLDIDNMYGNVTTNNIMSTSIRNFFIFLPEIIASIFIISLPAVMIITNLHLPGVLNNLMGLDRSMVHFDSMIGIAVLMFFNPFMHQLSRLPSYIYVLLFPAFGLLSYSSLMQGNTLFFFVFYQAIISMLMISLFKIVVYGLPVKFRVSGMSFAYNIAFIGASFFPILLKDIHSITPVQIVGYAIMFCIALLYMLSKQKVVCQSE